MNQSDNETAQSPFLSEAHWAEQEVIDYLRQSVHDQLVSLTHSEQLRYRQLVRQYATSVEVVERDDKKIKDDFETFGVQRIRERLLALTGKDLDPHTTFIHTRYLHTPERQKSLPQRLRRSLEVTDQAEVLPEPHAYLLVSAALADDDPARAELSLARVIRGNFRLSVLDAFAVEDGSTRRGDVDVLEIGFTYRLALTEALQLPAQLQAMRFAALGRVDADAIERAKVAILAMDNGDPMLDYMVRDSFWDEFLRARYADQFGAVYDASHRVVAGRDVYDSERYERELKALQNTLTLAALARL